MVAALAMFTLASCSTLYRPPVVVYGGSAFAGLSGVLAQSAGKPVDVVLVHGMCTHDAAWAHGAIDQVMRGLDANYRPRAPGRKAAAAAPEIEIVRREERVGAVPIRFSALVWSPLTTALKQQLAFDMTGTPTDCAAPGECKPRRARLNAMFKDKLLNDCLVDAVIYQGASGPAIEQKVIAALGKVLADGGGAPLVLIAESLGSKITFDALNAMLVSPSREQADAGQDATARLVQVFMAANQLPLLGLAEQSIDTRARAARPAGAGALERFLELRRALPRAQDKRVSALTLVAMTDPNDVLSYRLQPSRYAAPDVHVADVLVSNKPTWFGLIENPFGAHNDYLLNPGVTRIIACGAPAPRDCK
ncbi:hypothetical protein C7C56_002920 [Massilia glaciei]|uniref:Uncharacterized protein n=1 Tax=Massilia glaciei TaxID=1524097 RepID=A0A2U2I646_9BURK|nr:hypothetical protein C7C56_002920 [Massilia glaciei]